MDVFSNPQAALILSLSASVCYGMKARSPPSYFRMVLKTTATTALSLMVALRAKSTIHVLALLFGAIGDAFLAWDGELSFLSGLGSFLIAHLLYIVLFVTHGEGCQAVVGNTWKIAGSLAMMLLTPCMIGLLMPRVERGMKAPVSVYSIVITIMALTSLAVSNDRVISGAILFTISDTILATDKFLVSPNSTHRSWMQYAVWILYYSGQLLIATGLLETM
jgi:uncharacterized membrane protein YhhN